MILDPGYQYSVIGNQLLTCNNYELSNTQYKLITKRVAGYR